MSSDLRHAIIKTLAYADIFNYPLTLTEIKKYLISSPLDKKKEPISESILKKIPHISSAKSYYFFSSRHNTVKQRHVRLIESQKKMILARRLARLLFYIPTIRMIAVTGNLALMFAGKNDDIDLLIVTSENRIWTSRFLCVVWLKLLGFYRNPNSQSVTDKICLNMFIAEDQLTLPPSERDLYSAHEIIQAKPLFFKKGFDNIMLRKNPWVKKYLPNASVIATPLFPQKGRGKQSRRNVYSLISKVVDFLEYYAKKFQLFYMRRRRTSEIIRDGYLRFHPHDVRPAVLASYRKAVKKYSS